jgi:xylulokinase
MLLMGVDVGTTGCKVALFDEDGNLRYVATREYEVLIPHSGWVEQDVEVVWYLVQDAIREVIALSDEDATCSDHIEAIGLSVQGEAVVPVNASGRVLRYAILGMDTRVNEQNAQLHKVFGAYQIFKHTGMPIHTINTLPKLMWLKANEPEIWQVADKFLLYEDFIIQKMVGVAFISRCLASRTQLYDTISKTWSDYILDFLDLDKNKLGQIYPSGTPVGRMNPELAANLGFSISPLIVTGGHDQACGALGVGLTQPGLAMVSTGSAEVVEVVTDKPSLNEYLYEGNVSVYTHTVPDRYLSMTLNHSGGLVFRWFRDTFGQLEMLQANATGTDAYDVLLHDASAKPSGLLLLPHFAGSGTPTFDTASKGAFLGLTFSTTKSDLAKAVLEGLTYELKVNLEVLTHGGVDINELRAIGGGAKSPLWLQLKADVTGIPVAVPRVTESACWGAALLAGYGVGLYQNIAEAAEQSVVLTSRYEPDPKRSKQYESMYKIYCDLYPAVKDILHRLPAMTQ